MTATPPNAGPVTDRLGRPMRALRLSVTDRCNLRCRYCMPEAVYTWLPRPDLLSFEEILRCVDAFALQGVRKLRITGGEPLLRRDLPTLVAALAHRPPIVELALTTNAVRLEELARPLFEAGLDRLTVSIDTLDAGRFERLTRRDAHARVLSGIEAAVRAGFGPGLKIDTVAWRGVNDDEFVDLLAYARSIGAELRFIEYMDVGGATHWSMAQVVSRQELLARLGAAYGAITPVHTDQSATARRYRLADGTVFGIVASTTAPFCQSCDRSRLTADGQWYRCLYARAGTDLRGPLRRGASAAELAALIGTTWAARADRGAEERHAERQTRGPLAEPSELRDNPHLEMHTRGG